VLETAVAELLRGGCRFEIVHFHGLVHVPVKVLVLLSL